MAKSIYEDLVLQQLKELSLAVREVSTTVNHINDRLSIVETVLLGVNKSNGLKGDVNEIRSYIDEINPTIISLDNSINNPDNGILCEIKDMKDRFVPLESFKTKTIAIVSVIQILIGLTATFIIKFIKT